MSPEQDLTSGDYYCKIISNELFAKGMNVYGGTPHQAVRLAFAVANTKLTSRIAWAFSDDIPEDQEREKRTSETEKKEESAMLQMDNPETTDGG
jgi:hypothetical protein